MTQTQAITCGVFKEFMEYETARNLYYLLERFYETDIDPEPEAQSDTDKKSKKRQKMKTFQDFIKKSIDLLEELTSIQESTKTYRLVYSKVRTRLLKFLNGRPLLQRIIATHLFQEYSADMFPPENVVWLQDRDQLSNIENCLFVPSKTAVQRMSERKRLPTAFKGTTKNKEAVLPLATQPIQFNYPKVCEEVEKLRRERALKSKRGRSSQVNSKKQRLDNPVFVCEDARMADENDAKDEGKINSQDSQDLQDTQDSQDTQESLDCSRIPGLLTSFDAIKQIIEESSDKSQESISNQPLILKAVEIQQTSLESERKLTSKSTPKLSKDDSRKKLPFSDIISDEFSQAELPSADLDSLPKSNSTIWTPEQEKFLKKAFDNLELPEDESVDDEAIIEEFCKSLVPSLLKPWEDIKFHLDEQIDAQEE